jgi:CheY-like chemotaxis protein
VIVARDGVEALSLVEGRERALDLLVSDLVMPRLGGADLLTRLRVENPRLRALLMSGYSHDGDAAAATTPGTAHLGKPFTLDVLADAVRRLLDGPPPAED